MTFSESYMFVLVISLVLCIPLRLAIRTLLATKEYVILPVLRLCIMIGQTQPLAHDSSSPESKLTSSIQSRRTSW